MNIASSQNSRKEKLIPACIVWCSAVGSLAASWMTPGTIAGGIYATLESAAVGGYGLPIVASAIQGTGAGLAGLSVGSAAWLVRKEASNKDKDE